MCFRRAEGGNCERLLEDGLGAAVLHHRHGNALRRGKQGESRRVDTLRHLCVLMNDSQLIDLDCQIS